jgi:ribonuclease J
MAEAEGLVVATTFASNVARLKTFAEAARSVGRGVVVMGRAMQQMLKTARASEVLGAFPDTIDPLDAAEVPRRHLLVLATGSQGERRAAAAQLAAGKYLGIELKAGDVFVFSSRTIPGNEVAVGRILNQLSERGVRAIDDSDGRYHVSGHPNRPDLVTMHDLIRPQVVIPNHGEHRHLTAHAELARELGREGLVAPNGHLVEIGRMTARVVEKIETGRLYLDGIEIIGAMDGVVRERIRMATRGHVVVNVIIDEDGRPLGGSWVRTVGLPDDRHLVDGLAGTLEAEIDRLLARAKPAEIADDDALERLVEQTVSRVANGAIGKKPVTTVMISRLED